MVNFKWHRITSWKMILLYYNEAVRLDFYRPQRSCGKVMLLHLCVILFTGGGVSAFCLGGLPHPLGRHPPLGSHPPFPVHAGIHTPAQCMLEYTPPAQCILGYTLLYSACWDTINKRAVRILLECILVFRLGPFTWCDYDCDYVVWDFVLLLQSHHMNTPVEPTQPISRDEIIVIASCEQPCNLIVTLKKNNNYWYLKDKFHSKVHKLISVKVRDKKL